VAATLVADPADPRDLDEYATIAGASVRTLARLFRAETGMSFQQWRRQLRMTEAPDGIVLRVPKEQHPVSSGPSNKNRRCGYSHIPFAKN